MAENKTKPTAARVGAFLKTLKDTRVRADCETIIGIMRAVSRLEPVTWGSSIIGFGSYHYVYESGREGDNLIVGFSPRKQNIALYLRGGLDPLKDDLAKLGAHTTGKGCLYIKSMKDVDAAVLKRIVAKAYKGATSEDA